MDRQETAASDHDSSGSMDADDGRGGRLPMPPRVYSRVVVVGGNMACLQAACLIRDTVREQHCSLVLGACPAQQAATVIKRSMTVEGAVYCSSTYSHDSVLSPKDVDTALQQYYQLAHQFDSSSVKTPQDFNRLLGDVCPGPRGREVLWLLCGAVVLAVHGSVSHLAQQMLEYFSLLEKVTVLFDSGSLYRTVDVDEVSMVKHDDDYSSPTTFHIHISKSGHRCVLMSNTLVIEFTSLHSRHGQLLPRHPLTAAGLLRLLALQRVPVPADDSFRLPGRPVLTISQPGFYAFVRIAGSDANSPSTGDTTWNIAPFSVCVLASADSVSKPGGCPVSAVLVSNNSPDFNVDSHADGCQHCNTRPILDCTKDRSVGCNLVHVMLPQSGVSPDQLGTVLTSLSFPHMDAFSQPWSKTDKHFNGYTVTFGPERVLQPETRHKWEAKGLSFLLLLPVCTVSRCCCGSDTSSCDSVSRVVDRTLSLMKQRLERPLSRASQHCRVLVVGAGAAALGALTILQMKGVRDIIVLEGANRLGGRVHSLYPSLQSEAPVELGAQWIHGEVDNCFHIGAMSVAPELLSEEYSTDGDGIFLLPDGTEVPKSVVKEVGDYCQACEKQLEQKQLPTSQTETERAPCRKPNVAAVFNENQQWDTLIKSKPEHLRPIYQALFDWNIKWYLADNACQNLQDLSVKHWARYKYCEGEFNINPSQGMLEIIRALYSLMNAQIYFNSVVKRIKYASSVTYSKGQLYDYSTGEPAVTVTCEDGTVMGADAVIVTCSIGHLQHNKQLFSPPLPEPLSKAINSMGFGTMNKIILEYKEPWWQRYDGQSLQFVWQFDNSDVADTKWEHFLTGFDVTYGSVPRLTGWVGGKGALLLESCPEQEVARTCTILLRKFLSRDDIPIPCAVYRSRWHRNPLFRGSYSHPSVEFERNECSTEQLNTPVMATLMNHRPNHQVPLVSLAGEANSRHFFSTVHGAMANGLMQGGRVAELSELLDSLISSKL